MHPDIAAMLICTLSQPTDQERRLVGREGRGAEMILAAILMGEAFLVKKIVKIRQEAGSLISDEGSRSWRLEEKSLLTNKGTGEVKLRCLAGLKNKEVIIYSCDLAI